MNNKKPPASRSRLSRLLPLALLASLAALPAQAAYPDHVIKGVIPFTPGGTSDILARLFGIYMSQDLGQNVVMENKPGAGGNIGMESVAHAKPDGYTILFISNGVTQNPALYRTMPFDPEKDLVPVAFVGDSSNLVVVNAQKFPTGDLKAYVEYLKKNPGKANFSSADSGLSSSLFRLQTGTQYQIVLYNSSNDAMTAAVSGEADATVTGPISVAPAVATGKVRALAVAGENRLSNFPGVPTAKEAGLPDYRVSAIFGVFVPRGTAPEIIQRLNAAAQKAVAAPEVNEKMGALGWTTIKRTPAQSLDFYLKDIKRWRDTAKQANIQPID